MTSESLAKYIIVIMMVASVFDSAVKELTWMPSQAKVAAFYILPPIILAGIILLVPYLRAKMAIVTSGSGRRYAVNAYVGVTALVVAVWAVMYYQAITLGSPGIAVSQTLKDALIVFSIGVYALLARRLFSWYQKTKNIVVLLFGLNTIGLSVFVGGHLIADFVAKPLPRIIPDGLATIYIPTMGIYFLALIIMHRTYYGSLRNRYLAIITLGIMIIMVAALFLALRLAIPISSDVRTVLSLGLELSAPMFLVSYLLLVPALPNETSKGYFRAVGYGIGLGGAATCGMGLGLFFAFPIPGFASMSMLIPAATLSYAGFLSSASYFSISEEVRKEIRGSTAFVASIGAAESLRSTDEQIKGFYDRFTGLAKESGAVEAAAISESDIYEYARALKKTQPTRKTK